ncbi:spore germination protein [Cohnella panacarvi]|uniref:spore germination protein n=1 Tax=Cohnella panacarvi TaxID=400776 RepID=UPI00047DFC6E|nr:spore germination protein [Cohnella panacarvi]
MELLEHLRNRQRQDADLFIHRIFLDRYPVTLVGATSLIDLPQTVKLLQTQVRHVVASESPLLAISGGIGERIGQEELVKVFEAITEGKLIIIPDNADPCIKLFPISRKLSRSIEAPMTENVLRGGISAFTEDLDTNIGIVKKQTMTDKLRIHTYWLGSGLRRKATLLYMDGAVNSSFLRELQLAVESHSTQDVPDLQTLNTMLGFTRWSLVTRFNTTELPENASFALNEGKVVMFLDRLPFAIVLPSLVGDMFASDNDRNYPLFFMLAIRLLRIVGVLINTLMPGVYVALVSVNPDVLRIELAMSIAGSRVGVPYPAIVETVLLLVTLELILEACIRLPKSIGTTITMVGGIILGQAVVEARLVSNVLIIILAATTIASFTVIGFHNAISIRISKYVVLILSALFGVLGLFAGMIVISAYLASISSFGVPYLSWPRSKEQSDG